MGIEERFGPVPPLPEVEDIDERFVFEENADVELREDDEEDLELREDEEESVDQIITHAAEITGFSAGFDEHVLPDGTVVSEGDMILTPEQQAEDAQERRMMAMGLQKRKGIKSTRK